MIYSLEETTHRFILQLLTYIVYCALIIFALLDGSAAQIKSCEMANIEVLEGAKDNLPDDDRHVKCLFPLHITFQLKIS